MKLPPAWLAELHRQWQRTRGTRVQQGTAAFSRNWEDLLDAAGLRSAEERAASVREAAALERGGHLQLARQRYRDSILRVRLPVTQEAWLRGLFQSDDPANLRQLSLEAVDAARARGHSLYPDLWARWCGSLVNTFATGRNQWPLRWRQPEHVRALLALVHELTTREWPSHTLVRDADVALGRPTKTIERQRRSLEAALTQFFQRATTLEALNIYSANSRLLFDGPLTLEFADGTRHEAGHLRHGDVVTAADLARAVRMTTTASRILSVENSKTTFRNLAAQNDARDTLLVATSFPTQAVRLLLEKLPVVLPHFHFGDTDPAGYFILSRLREVCPRPVVAWQMDWRDKPESPTLSGYDRRVLERLLMDPNMEDVKRDLHRMSASCRKGEFEQETRPARLVFDVHRYKTADAAVARPGG